jgi:hypothetical protein
MPHESQNNPLDVLEKKYSESPEIVENLTKQVAMMLDLGIELDTAILNIMQQYEKDSTIQKPAETDVTIKGGTIKSSAWLDAQIRESLKKKGKI